MEIGFLDSVQRGLKLCKSKETPPPFVTIAFSPLPREDFQDRPLFPHVPIWPVPATHVQWLELLPRLTPDPRAGFPLLGPSPEVRHEILSLTVF